MIELKINALENGPLLIPGSMSYKDLEGREQLTPGKVIALCRCGQSANRPFCDGVHKQTGFQSRGLELTQKAA